MSCLKVDNHNSTTLELKKYIDENGIIIKPLIVYKSVQNCIATLLLEIGTKTNLHRKRIKSYIGAKFRCDQAFVKDIVEKETQTPVEAVESDRKIAFIYTTNKSVYSPFDYILQPPIR